MPKYRKLTFKIRDFTPHTLPMARLSEYLADYAKLCGNESAVHFMRVGDGSAALHAEIEEPLYPAVRRRAVDAAKGVGHEEAVTAYRSLNAKLRQDKTAADLQTDREKKILAFPGATAPEPVVFGPFNQQGTLEGVLIKVGGKDKTIPVHIEGAEQAYICNATREMARKLAPYLFGEPIRVSGTGRWTRSDDGTWTLVGFNIEHYEELNNDPLPVVIERLRAIPDNGWNDVDDPLSELNRIRRGNGRAN
jgi:hypothetical protein